MKQTLNYGLNLFEGRDKVSLAKINENTRKLDEKVPAQIAAETKKVTAYIGDEPTRMRLLAREASPYEVGPYRADPASKVGNYVVKNSAGNVEYDAADLAAAPGARITVDFTYVPLSVYSLADDSENCKAVRINHRTKTPEVFLDLTSKKGHAYDRVVCVDEDYVYFARHAVSNESSQNGYLEKYRHSGELVESVKSGDSEWAWDTYYSFQGGPQYTSIFKRSSDITSLQTKNYIVMFCRTSVHDANGNYYQQIRVFSKSSLRSVGMWAWAEFTSTDLRESAVTGYGADILLTRTPGSHNYLYRTLLSAPGAKESITVRVANSPASSFIDPVSFVADYAVMLVTPSDGSAAKWAMCRISDFASSDTVTVVGHKPAAAGLDSNVGLRTNYDPATDKFYWNGVEFDPFVDGLPTTERKPPDGYTEPLFAVVGDAAYFVDETTYDVYETKTPVYVVDRMVIDVKGG